MAAATAAEERADGADNEGIRQKPYWVFTRCPACNVDLMFEEPKKNVYGFIKIDCPSCGGQIRTKAPFVGTHVHTGDVEMNIKLNKASLVEVLKVADAFPENVSQEIHGFLDDPYCRPRSSKEAVVEERWQRVLNVYFYLFLISLASLLVVPLFIGPFWTALPILGILAASFFGARVLKGRLESGPRHIPVMCLSMFVFESESGIVCKVMAKDVDGGLKNYFMRARGLLPLWKGEGFSAWRAAFGEGIN